MYIYIHVYIYIYVYIYICIYIYVYSQNEDLMKVCCMVDPGSPFGFRIEGFGFRVMGSYGAPKLNFGV